MHVLMFGWEFPPHISGGLGTACHGLTKGLLQSDDVQITFVVPKALDNKTNEKVNVLGANQVELTNESPLLKKIRSNQLRFVKLEAHLTPYLNETDYQKLLEQKAKANTPIKKSKNGFTVDFSGKYSYSLLQEIDNYAILAEEIVGRNLFDLIHVHDWMTFKAGIAAKKQSKKPLIVHVHSTEYDRSRNHINPHIYSIEKEGFEQADKIITVSNYTKNILINQYDINSDKITTVYNAVTPVENLSQASIQKSTNEKLVTFLGRITSQKGPEYFINVAQLILEKYSDVRFVMAGNGDMQNSMIEKVAEMGISDRFHFTGFLSGNDVHHIFQLTDVFIMPSVSEPFGIVTLEAMHHNVPVIISNQSGVAEVLTNAIKVDFWDIYTMADAVYGLLSYSSLSNHLIKKGKNEVGDLTWQNAANKVLEIYDEISCN